MISLLNLFYYDTGKIPLKQEEDIDDKNSDINTIDARDYIESNNDLFNVNYYTNGKLTSEDDFIVSSYINRIE
jgi:hypothetical protein